MLTQRHTFSSESPSKCQRLMSVGGVTETDKFEWSTLKRIYFRASGVTRSTVSCYVVLGLY